MEEEDAHIWVRWEWVVLVGRWLRELPLLLLTELQEAEQMGGRTKSVCVNTSSVASSSLGLIFPLTLNGLSALTVCFSVFSAPSGSGLSLCTCLEAAGGAEGGGLKTFCCDWIVALLLSLCARAVIGDKCLEGLAEDINVRVRRGILLRLVFVGRLLWCDWLTLTLSDFFLLLLGWCFGAVVLLVCFVRPLTLRVLPLSPFFLFPLSSSPFSSSTSLPFFSSCCEGATGFSPSPSWPSRPEGEEGLLLADAARFFLLFPFLLVFDSSGMIPPRRPLAAALASTSWTVSTLVGSAWKNKGSLRFDVKTQHIKTTGL